MTTKDKHPKTLWEINDKITDIIESMAFPAGDVTTLHVVGDLKFLVRIKKYLRESNGNK